MGRLDRRLLYAAATSDRLEAFVHRWPPLRRAAYARAGRVVAGESLSEALATLKQLVEQGFAVSVDRFGEGLNDVDRVAGLIEEYRALSRVLSEVDGDIYLDVVPSHVGLDISVEYFCDQMLQVASFLPARARLEVSAEESHRTPRIIEGVLRLAEEDVPVVATLQANLRRSESDAYRLVDSGIPVRLVKGAYLESSAVAYEWGEQVDVAFVRLAHQIVERGGTMAIATHDPVIREALLRALDGCGIEMLFGVRPDDALDLVSRGHQVRIYVPYGSDWFRYWMRRVAESRGA